MLLCAEKSRFSAHCFAVGIYLGSMVKILVLQWRCMHRRPINQHLICLLFYSYFLVYKYLSSIMVLLKVFLISWYLLFFLYVCKSWQSHCLSVCPFRFCFCHNLVSMYRISVRLLRIFEHHVKICHTQWPGSELKEGHICGVKSQLWPLLYISHTHTQMGFHELCFSLVWITISSYHWKKRPV